jgi:hypothetical protein
MELSRTSSNGFPPNSFGAMVQAQRTQTSQAVQASQGVQPSAAMAQLAAKRALANQPAQATPPEVKPTTPAQAPAPANATLPKRLHRAYAEIESIAQKAGYVGLSMADVERAYAYNTSLLVDYKA